MAASSLRIIAIVAVIILVLASLRLLAMQSPLEQYDFSVIVETLQRGPKYFTHQDTAKEVVGNATWEGSIDDSEGNTTAKLLSSARNSTLGFGTIYYISLDQRTDKQDAMILLAEFTGLQITRVPGVDGDSIPPQAIPHHSKVKGGSLGCWRAHANAWRRVLEEGIGSALIMEDDADWDVALKEEFELLSNAVWDHESILDGQGQKNSSEQDRANNPYGSDWDVLYMGHCHHDPDPNGDLGFKYQDPSTADYESLDLNYKYQLNTFEAGINGFRTVSKAYAPVCTTAYAVSHRGAARLLYNIGYAGLNAPVDNEIAGKLQDGKLQGLTVTPPLISMFKTGSSRDSDINGGGKNPDGGVGNEKGSSKNLRKSARKAMKEWVKPQGVVITPIPPQDLNDTQS